MRIEHLKFIFEDVIIYKGMVVSIDCIFTRNAIAYKTVVAELANER